MAISMALDVKDELLSVLDGVDTHSAGSFAASGEIKPIVNPGLYVKDLGIFGLPLSNRDAAELGKAAHRAPFGKGSKTLVDTNVRSTWELNPDQFGLRNPDWAQCINQIVIRVAGELGIAGGDQNVRAEIYTILLYEEGAFFERHKE